jgi:2,4-dienoyl-CoA reductase-like NADH-dependent reductase (Old Yellow Enzyme family)
MSGLFESTSMRGMNTGNRFVRSATWEGAAEADGSVTHRLVDMYRQLARGGVGLIITGHAFVTKEGQAAPFQLGVYSDGQIPGLAEIAGTVHGEGGRIVMQLAHAGSRATSRLTGLEPLGPSPVDRPSGPVGREMTGEEIKTLTQAFAVAALRARQAGFDGVQIHGAHGYLLSQFLSPLQNRRKDEYGGDAENRTRIVMEVLKAIRGAVGADYPVLIKLNSDDFVPGGVTVEDMLYTALKMEEGGIDGVEMSGGTFESGRKNPSRPGKPEAGESEAYYEAAAGRYKEKIGAPLILVGGIRSIETAERLVAQGKADYISLSRPLIREPGLINRWKSGDRRPAACVSDNGCFKPGVTGTGIYCVVEASSK